MSPGRRTAEHEHGPTERPASRTAQLDLGNGRSADDGRNAVRGLDVATGRSLPESRQGGREPALGRGLGDRDRDASFVPHEPNGRAQERVVGEMLRVLSKVSDRTVGIYGGPQRRDRAGFRAVREQRRDRGVVLRMAHERSSMSGPGSPIITKPSVS